MIRQPVANDVERTGDRVMLPQGLRKQLVRNENARRTGEDLPKLYRLGLRPGPPAFVRECGSVDVGNEMKRRRRTSREGVVPMKLDVGIPRYDC